MALTLSSGLTLILLTVCIGFAQGQETTEYHDLLKQSQKRLLHDESEGDFLYRHEVAAILRYLLSTEWNYTQSLVRSKGIRSLSVSSNVSEACSVGLQLLEYGLLERKPWSLKMLDAFFKVPSGLFDGDFSWPGQYDECVEINEVFTDHQPYNMTFLIRGKYFMANFKSDALIANTLIRLKVGLCLPDVCAEKDVEKLLDYYMEYLRQNLTLNMTLNSVVHPHTEYEATPELIIASLFCSIIGFLVVVGTLADMFVYPDDKNPGIAGDKRESGPPLLNTDGHHLLSGDVQGSQSTLKQRLLNNGKLRSFLVTFSISTNGSKVLSTEAPPPSAIQAVNGVRVLSMGWVILGHTYIFMTDTIKNPGPLLTHWIHRWTFQIVLNAIFSVDSFFLLSGLLVSYLTLQELEKRKGKINWLLFYFHRFWRLTPPMMLVLLVYTAYFQYWGSGPQWPQRSPDHAVCSKYWWRNLIYIQNFFPLREECMAWCWYMANDMQFFVISPLLIYPLYRKPVIGYIIVLALLLMQAIYRGVTSISLKMTMNSSTNQEKFFDEMYQRPYARIAPYVIGVLTGFFLWKSERNVRMPKIFALLGWVIALVFVSSVIFGTIRENGGHRNSLSVDALYNSLSVMTWSLGLAWVIFACNIGHGGFINTFLSAGIWSPLSRLTYCAYLVHPVIMFIYSLCQRYNIYATDINMVFLFFGFWMCTYIVAFFVSMAFEAPMIGLEKLLLKKPTKSS